MRIRMAFSTAFALGWLAGCAVGLGDVDYMHTAQNAMPPEGALAYGRGGDTRPLGPQAPELPRPSPTPTPIPTYSYTPFSNPSPMVSPSPLTSPTLTPAPAYTPRPGDPPTP
jgi:hypothetical protein